MEFKVGDEVKYTGEGCSSVEKGDICTIHRGSDGELFARTLTLEKNHRDGCSCQYDWELINSKSLHKTMEKKVYNVLVVDKKTGKTDKNQVVTAENEQSAILKAFGVDVENVFIKITEEGSYTEDKPVTAILVKENKAKQ